MAQSEPHPTGPNQATSEHLLADAITAAVDAEDDDRNAVEAAMQTVDDHDVDNEVLALARDVSHVIGSAGLQVVLHGDSRQLAAAYTAGADELDAGGNLDGAMDRAARALTPDDVKTDLDLMAVLRQALGDE